MRKLPWFLPFTAGTVLAALSCALGALPSKAPSKAPSALSEARVRESGTAARAPQAGQPFDDREIIRYFELEGRRLLEKGPLSKLSFDRRVCLLGLSAPSPEKIPLVQSAARAEAATLIFGEFYWDPKTKKLEFSTAAGGFLVNDSGACVTCLHVANSKESKGLVAMTRDGRVYAVREVLATDPVDDIAVLQLELGGAGPLPFLALAEEPAPIGSAIAVMSHPDERFYMLTTGTVARHTLWRESAGDEHFMTVTADFAKGSSGCPVLDERGAVVGLVNNTESIYYDDDGRKKQLDLQMVVKNTTPAWVVRRLIQKPAAE